MKGGTIQDSSLGSSSFVTISSEIPPDWSSIETVSLLIANNKYSKNKRRPSPFQGTQVVSWVPFGEGKDEGHGAKNTL
jgi:hypothetical protein